MNNKWCTECEHLGTGEGLCTSCVDDKNFEPKGDRRTRMTRTEAIAILKEEHKNGSESLNLWDTKEAREDVERYLDALKMAISALENHDEFMKRSYAQGKADAQKPCDDAISREELLKAIDTWDKFGVDDTNSLFRLDNLSLPHYVPYIHYDDVIKCIKGMPSVTQKSGKSGKWIAITKEHQCIARDATYTTTEYKCSECGTEPLALYANDDSDYAFSNFCPNCGAKMQSEE